MEPVNLYRGGKVLRGLAWLLSAAMVAVLALLLVADNDSLEKSGDTLTVRRIEVKLPPPAEPPPPVKKRSSELAEPSIDLLGPSSGPELSFSASPKLALTNFTEIERPDREVSKIKFDPAQFINFPIYEVDQLDQVPRLVSSNYIAFPKSLRSRGVKRVETKVEIVIDQHGRAFVKKIIDPVYPEMVETIRKAINDSRFTKPKKNGQAVQAIYLYGLVFVDRS